MTTYTKITIVLASILSPLASMAATTIAGGGFVFDDYNAFQSATVTDASPAFNTDLEAENIFDGNVTGIDTNNAAIFSSTTIGTVSFIEFDAGSAIKLDTIKLALRESANGKRAADNWTLLGSNTSGVFNSPADVIATSAINSDYAGTYGDNLITVTSSDLGASALRYYRLEVTQADTGGVRIMELGAVAIPEPSAAAAFLGLGAIGLVFVRRNWTCA